MKRFILLSFGFMALAFYELSGGADFDPVAARNAAVMARTDGALPAEPVEVATAETNAPEVTRMSLSLTSFEDVLTEREAPAPPAAETPAAPEPQVAALETPNVVGITAVTFDGTPDAQGVVPSIIFPGTSTQASSAAVSTPRDIRFVSAAVVNMRGGPGTGFDVVTKLNRDTQVEILQDDGTGWVKLRPLTGGPEGWIADYLLTNG